MQASLGGSLGNGAEAPPQGIYLAWPRGAPWRPRGLDPPRRTASSLPQWPGVAVWATQFVLQKLCHSHRTLAWAGQYHQVSPGPPGLSLFICKMGRQMRQTWAPRPVAVAASKAGAPARAERRRRGEERQLSNHSAPLRVQDSLGFCSKREEPEGGAAPSVPRP